MTEDFAWVVDRVPYFKVRGPYLIIERTKNGWIKFKDHASKQKGEVFDSERSALMYCAHNVEREIRIRQKLVDEMKSRIDDLDK